MNKLRDFNWCVSVYMFVFLLSVVSCKEENKVIHVGENRAGLYRMEMDTIRVNLGDSSGEGNFYLKDSIITFVDHTNCTFYDLNLQGQLVRSYFGKGHGKNELSGVMDAYPIENDALHRGIIIDQGYLATVFDRENRNLIYSKKLDFGRVKGGSNDYKSPGLYGVADDFGITLYLESDSVVILPVTINRHKEVNPDGIDGKRYEEGAIFGKLNLNTMKVEEVTGKFPEIFKHKPMPHLESFQYVISNDLLYVNHGVDSLIYVYKFPDDLQYTMGYECAGIDRDYTCTEEMDDGDILKNDIKHVGINTGLLFCPENNTLCRSYIKSMTTGASGMQIYKNNDLIADVEVPSYFKLLGYRGGCYYGARLIPDEDVDSTYLILYRIKFDYQKKGV